MKLRTALATAVAGGLAAAAWHSGAQDTGSATRAPVPAQVVAYAKARLGKPYVFGGPTAPGTGYGFDCSGLAMEAYASAGITIPRTSQEQWAAGPQVSTPRRGDLVFFAGSDGTDASPGHVGVVVNPKRHIMIDAYGKNTLVRYDTYGEPGSAGGLQDVVGFTDPAGGQP